MSKVLWGDPKILDRLLTFDKDNIPPEALLDSWYLAALGE